MTDIGPIRYMTCAYVRLYDKIQLRITRDGRWSRSYYMSDKRYHHFAELINRLCWCGKLPGKTAPNVWGPGWSYSYHPELSPGAKETSE